MVQRRIRLFLITVLGFVALLAWPTEASGCNSERPSFAEAIRGAEAIAVVAVENVTDFGEPRRGETFRVLEVLKGSLAGRVQLDEPRTTLCGDTVGSYAPEGTQAIVAFGLRYYDTVIQPVWVETGQPSEPITGSVPAPDGVTTLAELRTAIVAAMPDTAIPAAGRSSTAILGIALVGLGVASAALLPRRRLRMQRVGDASR